MSDVPLDEALEGKPADAETRELIHLEGNIGPDHDNKRLRLYSDAVNRRTYFLIRKGDVRGDVYRWEREELAAAGFSGQTRYRVAVRSDATVQRVTSWSGRLSSLESGLSDRGEPKPRPGQSHLRRASLAQSEKRQSPESDFGSLMRQGSGELVLSPHGWLQMQQNAVAVMSSILKDQHDTLKAIISNMKS